MSTGGAARSVVMGLESGFICVELSFPDRKVWLRATTFDGASPDFSVQLVHAKDAELFVPNRGWTLTDSKKLECALLARPPTPPVPYEVLPESRALFKEMHLAEAVKRGPSGFLDHYSPLVLGAAISAAFDAPIHEEEMEGGTPLKVQVSKHISSKWGPDYTEDGLVCEEFPDERLVLMAAVDGHCGDATMRILVDNAASSFAKHWSRVAGAARDHKIKTALKHMIEELDEKCFAQAEEVYDRNEASGAAARLAQCFQKTKKRARHPEKECKHEMCSGAVACFAVLDLSRAVAHTASVGDCFAFVRDSKSGKCARVSLEHSAGSARETARIMLEGGYVCRYGGAMRAFGSLMASRAFGECDLKGLRPEIARALKAEPAFTRIQLSPEKHSHFAVATDGLWVDGRVADDASRLGGWATSLAKMWCVQLKSDNYDDCGIVVAELSFQS